MPTPILDRVWQAVGVLGGAVLLALGWWYVRLLAPIVDPPLVAGLALGVVVTTAFGTRAYARSLAPIDADRPSGRALIDLTADVLARTRVRRPRLVRDDSRLARAVANVGAVEMGRGTETLVFTEQVIADLEARRFDPHSLRGVILHELGHLHHDHAYHRAWLSLGERLVRLGALSAVVALLLSAAARRELLDRPELGPAIIAGPLVVAAVLGVVSRGQETQADAFAVRHAAGRELLDYLRWLRSDLGPILALDRSGLPRDAIERLRIIAGLERLVAEAETAADEERAAFFRAALDAVRAHVRAEGGSPAARLTAGVARLAAGLVLAWLGILPAARSHPDIDDRIARLAGEMGRSAAAARHTTNGSVVRGNDAGR